MAQRIDRSVSDATKKKISDSMKRYHQSQSVEEKRKTNAKRSESIRQYWSTIPPKREPNQTKMSDLVL